MLVYFYFQFYGYDLFRKWHRLNRDFILKSAIDLHDQWNFDLYFPSVWYTPVFHTSHSMNVPTNCQNLSDSVNFKLKE